MTIYDVFISYSTEDQKVAERLSTYLEQNGIRCFIACRDIPKGVNWAETVTLAIENSKIMVIVFSEHFNRSKQVDREITLSTEESKPILTFKIQNVTFTGTKKYYLQNLNWIDAFPYPEKYFETLRDNVLRFIPEIRLQKENQEKQNKEEKKEAKQKISGKKEQEKQERKKRPKYLYYLAGVIVAIIILLTWLLIPSDKSVNDSDNILIPINDTTNTEPLSPTITSDTSNIDANNNISNSDTVTPPIKPAVKNTEIQNSEKNAEYIETTFTASITLVSTSGEQFTAAEGDIFKGNMKDGKVVQGKIIRDGKTIKTFFEKRNH